ncbi:hypothetical protein Tco_0362549, partial [Tanacetum coccineum]
MDWTHPMNWTEGSNEASRDGEQFPAQATQQSVIHAEPDKPMDQTTNEDVAIDMDQTTNEDVAVVYNGKGKAVEEAAD